eukprot:s618_g11.t1
MRFDRRVVDQAPSFLFSSRHAERAPCSTLQGGVFRQCIVSAGFLFVESIGRAFAVGPKPTWDRFMTDPHLSGTAKLSLVAFWYVVSFFGIVLNKTILSPGEDGHVGPLALVLAQMLSTVVFGKLREVIGRPSSSTSKLDWVKQRKSLLVLGVFRFFVAVMGLISLRYVAASFTETIKASSPFFTVVAAWFLTGERTPLPVLITLVPVMLGLITAAAGEHSFAVVGFVAAVLANLAECVQNVFCSQLLQPGPDGARFTSGQLQYYSACASLVVQIPFFGAAFLQGSLVLPNAALQWAWLLIAGFVYFLQSALAFKIMSCYSPVTLSVMNTAKRALIICFSAHYFGNVITNTALCGTVVTLLGSGLYSYLKSTIRRTAEDGKDSKMDRSSSASAVATHATKDSRVRSRLCGSRRFRPKGGAAQGYRYPMLAATVAMCSFPYVPPRNLASSAACRFIKMGAGTR